MQWNRNPRPLGVFTKAPSSIQGVGKRCAGVRLAFATRTLKGHAGATRIWDSACEALLIDWTRIFNPVIQRRSSQVWERHVKKLKTKSTNQASQFLHPVPQPPLLPHNIYSSLFNTQCQLNRRDTFCSVQVSSSSSYSFFFFFLNVFIFLFQRA